MRARLPAGPPAGPHAWQSGAATALGRRPSPLPSRHAAETVRWPIGTGIKTVPSKSSVGRCRFAANTAEMVAQTKSRFLGVSCDTDTSRF